jgi:adenine/guanine phosphoribosyltransferase-like PRPP-binding protein
MFCTCQSLQRALRLVVAELELKELVVMLGWKAIFTLVVVGLMFVVLAANKFNDTLVIFLAFIL